jgi:hypothetical protein
MVWMRRALPPAVSCGGGHGGCCGGMWLARLPVSSSGSSSAGDERAPPTPDTLAPCSPPAATDSAADDTATGAADPGGGGRCSCWTGRWAKPAESSAPHSRWSDAPPVRTPVGASSCPARRLAPPACGAAACAAAGTGCASTPCELELGAVLICQCSTRVRPCAASPPEVDGCGVESGPAALRVATPSDGGG